MKSATDDNTACCEGDFFSDLGLQVPASLLQCGVDEFGANVPFCELFFVHIEEPASSCLQPDKRLLIKA